MEKHIVIRTPLPEDARGIVTVLYKTWLATYPNPDHGITTEDIEESYKHSFSEESIKKQQENLRSIPKHHTRVIATDGDVVVGTAMMVRNEDTNQLKTIYVLPEYQGNGIGTLLWNELAACIDPTKDTIVHVADYNQRAINFYKKLGFVDTGKRWKDTSFCLKSGAAIPEMELVLKKSK